MEDAPFFDFSELKAPEITKILVKNFTEILKVQEAKNTKEALKYFYMKIIQDNEFDLVSFEYYHVELC